MIPSNPFSKTDELLLELSILQKSFEIARGLPEALMKAFGAKRLLEYSCFSQNPLPSVEDSLQVLGPDSINRARWLADWIQETEGFEVTKVPDSIPHLNSYRNLQLLRESWDLIIWFHDAVQRSGRKFPEPFLRELELLVIATHALPERDV